ncbi:hypothetical protein HIM_10209 [Hirsutella minnesotensis 3608]|uniref:AAA+ ATPase domain-containing protein n=1 Tax=Hirsutella minnesotensis 3608 TaxID=1043627 RepID=A0A0F7ZKC2_9HYPO|nr:hypothetical protein HIM_10209 [Hirsutella minnesotensis 3608]
MLRSKPLTVLQKTYDDSYLSCSTAVYYESQGDEIEAMRHWRNALEQIHRHRTARSSSTKEPQTDTEKALLDAINQLELQCKERIDLLEALRVSRQDINPDNSKDKASSKPQVGGAFTPIKGAIGQGTIPAITWSQLSRPPPLHRPLPPSRSSSENAVMSGLAEAASSIEQRNPKPNSPKLPSKEDIPARSISPEKHTMRTTLRSAKAGEKPSKPLRKSPLAVSEGPSKAATLAWSALGPRDRLRKVHSTDGGPSSVPNPRASSSDRHSKAGSSQTQWDRHSRRLITPRASESSANRSASPSVSRHSDEFLFSRPSLLSVTAASSALSSSSYNDLSTINQPSSRPPAQSPPLSSRAESSTKSTSGRSGCTNGLRAPESQGEGYEGKDSPGVPKRRKGVAKRLGPTNLEIAESSRAGRATHVSHSGFRPANLASASNSSDDDASQIRTTELLTTTSCANAEQEAAEEQDLGDSSWQHRKAAILKRLPPGVDEAAAKQILNDIVVQGDEVHWGDVAGLEVAKNALRETVVYPFLRPDLFMGLREPARGMLLFGPPGTGKTMLARAVATESKSTFFSISASSLTSKYLGESEKLVKALFSLARTLAPSIIFVDEIDSLLSQRSGSGEHEATRRIKTEFLIQWSDLQRAAAGREMTAKDKERGDANRVLVLAATNLPWAIDEAARRRFVRRQYIPLPEPHTRETQLRTLLGQQKHSLSSEDIHRLVGLTEGFSGSDITALAKDAAMGPLRSLGEALLHMAMDEIRPIMLRDFEASLSTIRPSVSRAGLKEYEDWAKEFGERGG